MATTANRYIEGKYHRRMRAKFLVRVGPEMFLYRDTGDTIEGISIPSLAAHLPYQIADELVQSLRRRGYAALVANIYGRPVEARDLATAS